MILQVGGNQVRNTTSNARLFLYSIPSRKNYGGDKRASGIMTIHFGGDLYVIFCVLGELYLPIGK